MTTWLGLLLLGVAVADLVRGRWARAGVAEVSGAVSLVAVGWVTGVWRPLDLLALVVAAGVVALWGVAVRRAVADGGSSRDAGLALLVLGAGAAAALVVSPAAGETSGPWRRWVAALPWEGELLDPDRLLLVLGLAGMQLATANLVVRLVLAATGTVAPAVVDTADDPSHQLKGGRLLGPMERLVIIGLGLAGEVTAASIVIAAKGLLRWPELQSRDDQARVHRLTEYFLVGSFVSWSLALGSLALLAG